MNWARSSWARAGTVAAVAFAAMMVAGCGGSSEVKPSAYVRSVCQTLSSWRNTIQGAGVALQSSGAATATRSVAKEDYQRFVSELVAATRRATDELKAAGTPSVPRGQQIAQRLSGGFDQATRGLALASVRVKSIQTDSASHFQLGASAVSGEIRSALEQIARASPGQSPELRSAAAKEPSCVTLAG
jgi:predicted small secreted protein